MKIKISKCIGTIIIAAGILLYFSPVIKTFIQTAQIQVYVDNFKDKYGTERKSDQEVVSFTEDTLYQEIVAYNQDIYESGQEQFVDPWSYEQSSISLEGFEDGIFGYIEIPVINQTLPLYIGASMENLAKGAAVLGQTSIPVGGVNTNSVIAGHRGYGGKPFFKEIEEIKAGDIIYIINPWETLTYVVEAIDIIDPYDNESVKIREGRDMVTLLTCHPYASGGQLRYVVYCVRDAEVQAGMQEESKGADSEAVGEYGKYIVASDGAVYESSIYEIDKEIFFRRVCAGIIIFLLIICLISKLKDKQRISKFNGQ